MLDHVLQILLSLQEGDSFYMLFPLVVHFPRTLVLSLSILKQYILCKFSAERGSTPPL